MGFGTVQRCCHRRPPVTGQEIPGIYFPAFTYPPNATAIRRPRPGATQRPKPPTRSPWKCPCQPTHLPGHLPLWIPTGIGERTSALPRGILRLRIPRKGENGLGPSSVHRLGRHSRRRPTSTSLEGAILDRGRAVTQPLLATILCPFSPSFPDIIISSGGSARPILCVPSSLHLRHHGHENLKIVVKPCMPPMATGCPRPILKSSFGLYF